MPALQKIKRVSVIIPSHNRHQMLREAIESVSNQTYPECEVIVIDDGSMPPVDFADLRAIARREIVLLRSDSPLGQAVSREKGEKVATGEFIFHLDDDDQLAPNAIESGMSIFDAEPEIDIIFFNVKGFGERANAFDQVQKNALEKVLQVAKVLETGQGIIRFEKTVFPALLISVPMAFQRPMAKREVWRNITELRRKAYSHDHPLSPPLRESEWTLYAAATRRVALITHPLYLQRCDGQGYFSIGSKRKAAERARIQIFEHLLQFSETEPELRVWLKEIKQAVAQRYFNEAYIRFYRGERIAAMDYLLKALVLRPRVTYLRFGLRMLFPKKNQDTQQPL